MPAPVIPMLLHELRDPQHMRQALVVHDRALLQTGMRHFYLGETRHYNFAPTDEKPIINDYVKVAYWNAAKSEWLLVKTIPF
jgi:hypothetical protein